MAAKKGRGSMKNFDFNQRGMQGFTKAGGPNSYKPKKNLSGAA